MIKKIYQSVCESGCIYLTVIAMVAHDHHYGHKSMPGELEHCIGLPVCLLNSAPLVEHSDLNPQCTRDIPGIDYQGDHTQTRLGRGPVTEAPLRPHPLCSFRAMYKCNVSSLG